MGGFAVNQKGIYSVLQKMSGIVVLDRMFFTGKNFF